MNRNKVEDRLAITDQIYRYCRAVDRLDVPLGYSIWHEESIADYGESFQGTGHGFIDWVCAQHRKMLSHSHQVTNIIIELNDDKAASESYVTAHLRMQAGEALKQISVWSRYIDTWSKRDGMWRIDKRITLRDFDEVRTVTAMSNEGRAQRDASDPSYKVLKL